MTVVLPASMWATTPMLRTRIILGGAAVFAGAAKATSEAPQYTRDRRGDVLVVECSYYVFRALPSYIVVAVSVRYRII